MFAKEGRREECRGERIRRSRLLENNASENFARPFVLENPRRRHTIEIRCNGRSAG